MNMESKEVNTDHSGQHETIVTVHASAVTNGSGGGAIMEGSYCVYHAIGFDFAGSGTCSR
ncbi:hypothetical protein QD825_004433 [Salmonella enterica]|nr:hypothetical protein [Salmonella enterica]EAU6352198.1 hypothetical protein [Salmonella enterica]EDO1879230.1 hypothetical protein [Salmonella enterica]EDS2240941.1 hypothetical protein [Salmonella enterica]EEW8378764.1 hypothetical protein [Salmonella enterica]